MRTIRNICLFIICLIWASFVQASDLTPKQIEFRSNLMQFLKEEGFSPTIDDDDNSVNFKKEGDLHWITIDDSNPFYIQFFRNGFNATDANMDLLVASVNEANKRVRCAKAILNGSTISLVIEMYCHSAEEFRYIFYSCLGALETMHDAVYDFYNTAYNAPFTINSVSIGNVDRDGDIITSYGSTIYSYKTKYIKPKLSVNVNKAGTYDIYVKFYSPSGLSTSSDSPAGYSYTSSVTMTSGTTSYYVSGWGGTDAGHWKAGNYLIEFYYNGNLIGSKSFTIY